MKSEGTDIVLAASARKPFAVVGVGLHHVALTDLDVQASRAAAALPIECLTRQIAPIAGVRRKARRACSADVYLRPELMCNGTMPAERKLVPHIGSGVARLDQIGVFAAFPPSRLHAQSEPGIPCGHAYLPCPGTFAGRPPGATAVRMAVTTPHDRQDNCDPTLSCKRAQRLARAWSASATQVESQLAEVRASELPPPAGRLEQGE